MKAYDHKDIEKKWQERWEKQGLYKTEEDPQKEKCYVLDMFPYPSGEGLHVGHPKGYIATDVYSRMKRMQGFTVLHPMGWDAFGLPAENYAIKTKTHPRVAVEKNIARYKDQLSKIGFNYDWSREINTTDPEYYQWTQWIFLKLFEKGLAYQSHEPINWCPSCQTGLANEDVESDGTCERCGTKVEKRPMRQWVLKITDYADRLLQDLETLHLWPAHIKEQQRNWIGRSEGALIPFALSKGLDKVEVFTTRPDTLFGATYLVCAPEHRLLNDILFSNKEDVRAYVEVAKAKSEIERTGSKEKTGIKLDGVVAINPATKEEIPVFVADYVLAHYGTGAVMGVPAHDERDYQFAKKYSLPIISVIDPVYVRVDVKDATEFKKKNKIVAIVEDGKGNVLTIRWKPELGGRLFVGGTVEEGESPEQTALRELKEEAGYKNADILAVGDETYHYKYFAHSKNTAFDAKTKFVHIIVRDGVQASQSLEKDEEGKFVVEWVSKDQAEREVADPLHLYAFNKFIREKPYQGEGVVARSGDFDGLSTAEARQKITESVGGQMKSVYQLQDWVFSRQRYWGEPIPIIHCETCGPVPVPEKDLPVVLPDVEHYEPTGTGESPLANISEWVNVSCPKCGKDAKRETNTMPQWAGSSWYYLRYMDPQNSEMLVDPKKEKYWAPVDLYVGGAEHATRHLIYARFWHKFLFDTGAVSTLEPFTELHSVGLIQAEDGRKMSKRWGNVINPDDIVANVGADSLRVYEMFMGPFENAIAWSTNGLVGARRFVERVWRLGEKVQDETVSQLEPELNKTIEKVGADIQSFKFNTGVSQMMIFVNAAEKESRIGKGQYETLLKILAPYAPHVTEELWEGLGHTTSIHLEEWPQVDEKALELEMVTIAVQVGGKTRGSVTVKADVGQEAVEEAVKSDVKLAKYLDFKPQKVFFVPGKIINFVP